MKAARMGLRASATSDMRALAVAVGSVIAWGVRMTSTASTPWSATTMRVAVVKRSAEASPRTSTGLPWDQGGGMASLRAARVSSESCARWPCMANQGVGGHHAGTAGVGDDGQARAPYRALAGQELGAVEDVAEVGHPHDAGALEGGVVHGVLAGQGAGVAGRGLGALGEPAGLVGHDGLGCG